MNVESRSMGLCRNMGGQRITGRNGIHVRHLSTHSSELTCLNGLRAPTNGGVYHWVSEFAPARYQKYLSYVTGMYRGACQPNWNTN